MDPYILDEQKSPPWFARFDLAFRFVGAGAPLCGLLTSEEQLVCKSRGFDPGWADGLDIDEGILVRVPQLEPAREVMRLDHRLCAVSPDQSVKCLSAPGGHWMTEALLGPGIAAQLHGGSYGHWPCVILTDGTLACRGVEDTHRRPQCFEPASTQRFLPLAGWPKLKQFSAEHTFACGVAPGGHVYCAGSNGRGELGRAPLGGDCYGVSAVPEVSRAVKVQVARGGACALLDDGRVACWGVNHLAPTLDGGPSVRLIDLPDRVVDIGMAVASGWSSKAVICVLTSMGRVKCAGGNRHGEAGLFTAEDGGVRPRVVTEFRAVEDAQSWISVPPPQ